ncbi:MAG: hypothetical protein H6633_12725 [Anaerolineales bacterium]|nr:hypothetical protein [Anaerolineales bacterium]
MFYKNLNDLKFLCGSTLESNQFLDPYQFSPIGVLQMSLEGLEAILNKEEIVATQRPADLIDRPEMVDGIYTKHVRSYIPLGRQSQDGEDGQSVNKFENASFVKLRVLPLCEVTLLLSMATVKPVLLCICGSGLVKPISPGCSSFQMTQLQDLITATYGWLHYEVKRVRPDSDLLKQTQELYSAVTERSAESLAKTIRI